MKKINISKGNKMILYSILGGFIVSNIVIYLYTLNDYNMIWAQLLPPFFSFWWRNTVSNIIYGNGYYPGYGNEYFIFYYFLFSLPYLIAGLILGIYLKKRKQNAK